MSDGMLSSTSAPRDSCVSRSGSFPWRMLRTARSRSSVYRVKPTSAICPLWSSPSSSPAPRLSRSCVGTVMRAADATAQLVQLGEPELVGAVDDDRIGVGDVDARLDDRRAEQHVEALLVEVEHDAFEFALGHLPVGDADARFGNQVLQL